MCIKRGKQWSDYDKKIVRDDTENRLKQNSLPAGQGKERDCE